MTGVRGGHCDWCEGGAMFTFWVDLGLSLHVLKYQLTVCV